MLAILNALISRLNFIYDQQFPFIAEHWEHQNSWDYLSDALQPTYEFKCLSFQSLSKIIGDEKEKDSVDKWDCSWVDQFVVNRVECSPKLVLQFIAPTLFFNPINVIKYYVNNENDCQYYLDDDKIALRKLKIRCFGRNEMLAIGEVQKVASCMSQWVESVEVFWVVRRIEVDKVDELKGVNGLNSNHFVEVVRREDQQRDYYDSDLHDEKSSLAEEISVQY